MWARWILSSGDIMQSTYVCVERSSETAFQRELLEHVDVAVDHSRVVEISLYVAERKQPNDLFANTVVWDMAQFHTLQKDLPLDTIERFGQSVT